MRGGRRVGCAMDEYGWVNFCRVRGICAPCGFVIEPATSGVGRGFLPTSHRGG